MSTLPVKFSELKINDRFYYKGEKFIKIETRQVDIVSCCNFTRKTSANAKTGNKYAYFCADEEVLLDL